jgi:hypothetical protein
MKKIKLAVIICLIIMSSMAFAFTSSITTGKMTSSRVAITGPGYLMAINIITDGTNNVTVTLYDGTDSSGTQIWNQTVTGEKYVGGWLWNFPLKFETGIYMTISGTNGYAYIEYNRN